MFLPIMTHKNDNQPMNRSDIFEMQTAKIVKVHRRT